DPKKDAEERAKAIDHNFPDHLAWQGRQQLLPDRFKVFAARTGLNKDGGFNLRLMEALHYQTEVPEEGKNGRDRKRDEVRDIRAGNSIVIPAAEMIRPPGSALASRGGFKKYEEHHGAFGGAYAELLAEYLGVVNRKNEAEAPAIDTYLHHGPP